MSEPLNDEEFEIIKLRRKNSGVQSLTGDIDSLIATVEKLKAQTDWERVATQANKVIKKERKKWLLE